MATEAEQIAAQQERAARLKKEHEDMLERGRLQGLKDRAKIAGQSVSLSNKEALKIYDKTINELIEDCKVNVVKAALSYKKSKRAISLKTLKDNLEILSYLEVE
jgi:hypothetical protein